MKINSIQDIPFKMDGDYKLYVNKLYTLYNKYNLDINKKFGGYFDNTMLHYLISSPDTIDAAIYLIRNNNKFNTKLNLSILDGQGFSVLHLAIIMRKHKLFDELIKISNLDNILTKSTHHTIKGNIIELAFSTYNLKGVISLLKYFNSKTRETINSSIYSEYYGPTINRDIIDKYYIYTSDIGIKYNLPKKSSLESNKISIINLMSLYNIQYV